MGKPIRSPRPAAKPARLPATAQGRSSKVVVKKAPKNAVAISKGPRTGNALLALLPRRAAPVLSPAVPSRASTCQGGRSLAPFAKGRSRRIAPDLIETDEDYEDPVNLPTPGYSAPLPRHLWPPGITIHTGQRACWLPPDWAMGVKTTCRSYLPVFISPEAKTYYHKTAIEQVLGRKLDENHSLQIAIHTAKVRIAAGLSYTGREVSSPDAAKLLEHLSPAEQQKLAKVSDFHFGVVSAKRATVMSGIKDICKVEAALRADGIKARWYVDAESLKAYQELGLDAVVGGKLTPARNMVLDDAKKFGKRFCVQVSDDISGWDFSTYDGGKPESLEMANVLARKPMLHVGPLAAAQFLAASMEVRKVKLAGVHPTANAARALGQEIWGTHTFILGDFFVSDASSPVRFDTSMTLKEDYDYTCSHIHKYGGIARCNRLFLRVKHSTNAGGAVATRDDKGEEERKNIRILQAKWPGRFRENPHRKNEVIMTWRHKKSQQEDLDDYDE